MQQQIWFKKNGLIYIPTHPVGYVVTLLAIVFMVPVILAIIRDVHSVTDDLYEMFVYGTCTAFWWKWVAEGSSFNIAKE